MKKARTLGIVISREKFPPSHLFFEFKIDEGAEVKVGDYVEVPSERGGIVGRVYEIVAYSNYFSDPQVLKDYLEFNMKLPSRTQVLEEEVLIAKVRIVGVYNGEELEPPSVPPPPGERVYIINKDIMSILLGLSKDGILLGTSWGCNNIPVKLDIDTLIRHHIAVLGVTGTGKSYTCGVIIEEVLERGVPVVIIDPHGEYLSLSEPNPNLKQLVELRKLGFKSKGYPVLVCSPSPSSTINGGIRLTLRLSDLAPEAIAEMCNMTDVQEDLTFLAMARLSRNTLNDFEKAIEVTARSYGFKDITLIAIKRRLAVLGQLNILGSGVRPRDIVKPGVATIIDLSSDIPEKARRALVGTLLLNIFKARKRGEIPPLLVVVEEAHRFAPQEENTFSKTVLRKIAREGRKFGMGLCIASQRIVGLDKDILSQCGTKILLRIDSVTDLNFITPLIEHSSYDEVKRLPYLPIGVALVTGIALRYPLLVKIRPRKSRHGGVGDKIVVKSN